MKIKNNFRKSNIFIIIVAISCLVSFKLLFDFVRKVWNYSLSKWNTNQPIEDNYSNLKMNDNMMQDDESLVKLIKNKYLYRYENLSRDLNENIPNENDGLIKFLFREKIIDEEKKNGFFVEVGANDGEKYTSTRYLEKKLNWNGLLIDGAAGPYKNLLKKDRTAWHSNAVISPEPFKLNGIFHENPKFDQWGGLTYRFYKKTSKRTPVQMFPLYTFFLALGVKKIDLLILDIEGSESDVLRTLPFHLITLDVIVIELLNGKEGTFQTKSHLYSKGFVLVEKITTELNSKEKMKTSDLVQQEIKSIYYIFKKHDTCNSASLLTHIT